MGWNEGYMIFEKTVISVYDTGVLTKELLNAIMQPYIGSDLDHGGCMDLRSHDGLSAGEIVCKIMEPDKFAEIPVISDEKPDFIKPAAEATCKPIRDGYYFIDLPEMSGYRYGTWQDALKDMRSSAVYDLWCYVRRQWKLW